MCEANTLTDIDQLYSQFLTVADSLSNSRKLLLNELFKKINEIDLNPGIDSAMKIQAKLTYFKTIDDILKSEEALTINKVKIALAKKSTETESQTQADIVELLKNTSLARKEAKTNDLNDVENDLAKFEIDKNITFSEDELALNEDTSKK